MGELMPRGVAAGPGVSLVDLLLADDRAVRSEQLAGQQ
jgi:hypothetical protein